VIEHSIIAENSASTESPDVGFGEIRRSIEYSLIGDSTGAGLTEAPIGSPDANGNLIGGPINGIIDPLHGPLADNGGPTQTRALLPGSPAIDAGDPTIQHNLNQFDQRGDPFLRVTDGDLPDDIAIDIGAYEAQAPPSADFDQDSNIDGHDFLLWQRGYGTTVGAAKSDGNSDDDGDVDASDRAAWEVTFGEAVAPLASSESGNAPAELSVAAQQAAHAVSAAELIDVALAVELARNPTSEQRLLVKDQLALVEASYEMAFSTDYAVPVTSAAIEESLPATRSAEGDDAEVQWLADELLERVFG
jgi:hypothetical protein